jgi:hypothetical protein
VGHDLCHVALFFTSLFHSTAEVELTWLVGLVWDLQFCCGCSIYVVILSCGVGHLWCSGTTTGWGCDGGQDAGCRVVLSN